MDEKTYNNPIDSKVKIKWPDKKTDKKINLKQIRPLLKYYKKKAGVILFVVLLTIASTVISLLSSIALGNLLASFSDGFVFEKAIRCGLVTLILGLSVTVVDYLNEIIWSRASESINVQMSHDFIIYVNGLNQSCFDNSGSMFFINRLRQDINRFNAYLSRSVESLIDILGGFGFLIYTFSLNIYVGLFLIAYLLIYGSLGLLRTRVLTRNSYAIMEYRDVSDNLQVENIRGIKDVKGLNNTQTIVDEVDKTFMMSSSMAHKAHVINQTMSNFTKVVRVMLNFAFICLCAYLILHGQLFIAGFMIAYNYRGKILGMVQSIITLKEQVNNCVLGAQRINEVYDTAKFPAEHFGTLELDEVKGDVEFRNVSFEYYENTPVLRNLSFKVQRNSMVSLVGESGGGKSTIASLLNKLYSVEDGHIFIDGVDINQLSRDSLRNNVCLVAQAPYIFNMTIAENLRLAKPDATDEELWQVLKEAELYEFVDKLEKQMDSKLGENGIKLSGGQKQRLAIARALLKNAKIIVFDEATSSLDNENQAKIKQIMKRLSKHHTIIMIAHRLSTVIDSNNIIFIKDGAVLKEGTHEELMNTCEPYKKLYASEEI